MTRQIFWNLVVCSTDSISSPQAAGCIILPTRNKDGVSCYRCWGPTAVCTLAPVVRSPADTSSRLKSGSAHADTPHPDRTFAGRGMISWPMPTFCNQKRYSAFRTSTQQASVEICCFPAQESRFTICQIKAFLDAHRLEFLGFNIDDDQMCENSGHYQLFGPGGSGTGRVPSIGCRRTNFRYPAPQHDLI